MGPVATILFCRCKCGANVFVVTTNFNLINIETVVGNCVWIVYRIGTSYGNFFLVKRVVLQNSKGKEGHQHENLIQIVEIQSISLHRALSVALHELCVKGDRCCSHFLPRLGHQLQLCEVLT